MTPAYLSRLHIYLYFPSYILYFNCAFTIFTLLPLGLCTYLSLASINSSYLILLVPTQKSSFPWERPRHPEVPCAPIEPRKTATNSDHTVIYFVCGIYQGLVNYTP